MCARLLFACALVWSALPARADVRLPPPAADDVLPVHPLGGPYVALDAYCAQRRGDDDSVADCTVARRRGHTAVVIVRFGGGQREALLAVENGAGWWIDDGGSADTPSFYDGNRDRGSFVIEAIDDRPGTARLRGVQGFWWKPVTDEELAASDHDVYYCVAVEVRCWERSVASGPAAPLCSEALPVAGRRDCGLGSERDEPRFVPGQWDWEQQVRELTADGRDVEVRRRAWRHLPKDFSRYPEWLAMVIKRAQALAGAHRHIAVGAR